MKEQTGTLIIDDALMSEVWLNMGYKGAVPEQRIRDKTFELTAHLASMARLRYAYDIVPAERISSTTILLGNKVFSPDGIICSYLKGMTQACIFIGTAGFEFDSAVRKLKEEGDILTDFIADAIGSVFAERTVSLLGQELESIKTGISLPYSPGYCGWDIKEQHMFFSLFPSQPCGVSLSESSLMSPEKSVSGFFAMGESLVKQPYHCEICRNTRCFKRKK